jgi:hypothetical protein
VRTIQRQHRGDVAELVCDAAAAWRRLHA